MNETWLPFITKSLYTEVNGTSYNSSEFFLVKILEKLSFSIGSVYHAVNSTSVSITPLSPITSSITILSNGRGGKITVLDVKTFPSTSTRKSYFLPTSPIIAKFVYSVALPKRTASNGIGVPPSIEILTLAFETNSPLKFVLLIVLKKEMPLEIVKYGNVSFSI